MAYDTSELETVYDTFLNKGLDSLKELQINTGMEDEHLANASSQVIVGAMTKPGTIIPKKEWMDSIEHPNVFYKNNIKKYL